MNQIEYRQALRALEKLTKELLDAQPLLGGRDAAIALKGDASRSSIRALHYLIESKVYRPEIEVFDVSKPGARYRKWKFDITACRAREREINAEKTDK